MSWHSYNLSSIPFFARGPSGLAVREFDWYSGLGFKFQLDPNHLPSQQKSLFMMPTYTVVYSKQVKAMHLGY